jgi:hypothetical protein
MRVPQALPVLAVGVVLALGGCGSDDDTTTSTAASGTTAAPATTTGAPATSTATGGGTTITGTGYRTSAPAGWRDAKELAAGTAIRVDQLYASPEGSSFRANVVIIREDPAALKGKRVEDLEEQLRQQSARAVGADVPDAEDPFELDGEDAVRWTLRRKQGDQDLVQRQFAAIHDDALYTVTLTTTADDDADGEKHVQGLVGSWRWE